MARRIPTAEDLALDRLPVPEHLIDSDYGADAATREAFAKWVQQLWQDKDAQIGRLLAQARR